ncbi:MAG TPA: DUF1800 domain-containing protein [Tepidisphaeraceae bacterium]|jgi:hypothetical protein
MDCRRNRAGLSGLLAVLAIAFVVHPSPMFAEDEANVPPPAKKLTEQQILQKRIAEALSGRRDISTPKSQTLVGPELSEREKVMHVLDRMSYGAKPGEVDEVLKNGGWQAWVKQQMDPDHIDDATADRVIPQRFPWVKMDIHELQKDYNGKENQGEIKQMHRELPEMVFTQAVLSNRQFKEVMCDFWRNHFCVDNPGTYEKSRSWTDADYEKNVIRKYVFGKFGDMLFASARHPAMLEYLDNKLSYKNNWNENYAREVMELHTLGADRDYNNLDVQELSKALTGWTYNGNFEFVFNAEEAQPGIKYWRHTQLPTGMEGGIKALQVLTTDPLTANFISLKLCRYLVNDNPSPALVSKVASVFHQTQGDLPKVYMAIIESPEFMSRENYRCKFKTPFQFCVSACRTTQAKVKNAEYVVNVLRKMGEPVYDCPDPTGYFDTAERWMDAGVLTSRWQFAWDLARGSADGIALPESFIDKYKSLKPEDAIQKIIEDMLEGEVGDRELVAMKDVAQSNDIPRMLSIVLGSPSFQQR